MKISSSPRSYRSPQRAKRGIALVLVLAFVVILTVLALAFLSRALLNQQISVSSSSWVKVDIFAQGALKAAVWVKGRKAGLYGMDDVLGLKE